MKQTATTIHAGRRLQYVSSRHLPTGLTLLGVLSACVAVSVSGTPIPIERPWLLALACGVLLAPSAGERLPVLQRVVGLYLLAVPFNEMYSQYASISLASMGVSLSHSLGPLLLCAIGSAMLWRRQADRWNGLGRPGILSAWVIALGILVAHMLVLAPLFHAFYGYGSENNVRVLAHLSLYVLLLLIFWQPLGRRDFRPVSGLILAGFYLWLTLRK